MDSGETSTGSLERAYVPTTHFPAGETEAQRGGRTSSLWVSEVGFEYRLPFKPVFVRVFQEADNKPG